MSDFSSLLWIWVSNVKDKKSAYVPRSSVGFRASQAFHSCLYPLLEYQTWNLYRLLMCSNFSISGRDISTWDQTWMSKQNTHTVLIRSREWERGKRKEANLNIYRLGIITSGYGFRYPTDGCGVKLPLSWHENQRFPFGSESQSMSRISSSAFSKAPFTLEGGFTREFDQLNCQHVAFPAWSVPSAARGWLSVTKKDWIGMEFHESTQPARDVAGGRTSCRLS